MRNKSAIFRIVVWIIFLVGGWFLSLRLDETIFNGYEFPRAVRFIFFVIGFALLRAVFIVSKNTGRTLAKYGRKGDLPRFETNVLATEGLYSIMRHQMHLGLLFFPLAVALISASISFIFIVAPAEMLLMIIMIFLFEEREAIAKFGDAYLEYKKRVPFFCLKFSCIKEMFKNVEKN